MILLHIPARAAVAARRSRPLGLAVAVAILAAWEGTPAFASPELKALGSLIIPGLGQAANGDYGAGAFQFSAALVLARQYIILSEKEDYIEPEDRLDDENNEIEINHTTFYGDLYGSAYTDLSFYSSFAAYRDARQALRNSGYNTPPPRETIGDLMVAPFRWEFLARPTTFIPLLIPLYVLYAPVDEESLLYAPDDSISRNEMARGFFVQMGGVAIGEEAFFRGVLNNGLSSRFGELPGLLASSTLFGLAHAGLPGQANALTAGLYGLYLGWLHQRNDYEIGQGVAIHFWWNFLISIAALREREEEARVVLYTYAARF